jgi:hypothetical protein
MRPPTIPPHAGTLPHIDQAFLVERAYLMMSETGKYLPDSVHDGEWTALRMHLFESLQNPDYVMSKGQMKRLQSTLPKGPIPK